MWAGAAAILLSVGGFGVVAPVASATSSVVQTDISNDDDEAASSPTATTDPKVTITSVGGSTLREGEDLSVDVSVSNPSSKTLDIASLSLLSHHEPLTSRVFLLNFMAGGASSLYPLVTQEDVQQVAPGGTVSFNLTVPSEELQWSGSFNSWGPRGIEVQVELKDGTLLTDRSIALVAPETDLTPMPAAVAMPLTQSAQGLASDELASAIDGLSAQDEATATPTTPTGSASTPTATSTADPAQASQASTFLSKMSIPGVTLFMDPTLAQDNSESVSGALSNFAGTPDTEVALTPLYDADVAALTHADNEALIEQTYEESANLAKSLDISGTTSYALLPSAVDQNTVEALDQSGLEGVLLSDQDIPHTGFTYATPSARTEVQAGDVQMPALAIDSAVSDALAGHVDSGQGTAELSALDSRQLVLGLSAITYRERPNDARAMVISLDRSDIAGFGSDSAARSQSDPLNPSNLSGTIRALMDASWVDPHTVTEMFALEPDDAQREDLPTEELNSGEITSNEINRLDTAQHTIATYANLSEDPDLILGPAGDTAKRALATGLRSESAIRQGLVDSVEAVSTLFSNSLSVQRSSTINIISEATELPLHIRNDLPVSAGVVIRIESHDNRLTATKDVAVSLPAHGTTNVSIPVEAHGSGNIQVEVHILDPKGNVIAPSQSVPIRVRADWENVGTLVIAILLAVILAVGIVRSLRRGRKHAPVDPAEFSQDQRASRRAVWRHRT